ncbi:hypothetical protein CVS40_0004 [Lucilia cuprina]|nr:hypothetical protein CVS40_0004 [Lucilia cuprina]
MHLITTILKFQQNTATYDMFFHLTAFKQVSVEHVKV